MSEHYGVICAEGDPEWLEKRNDYSTASVALITAESAVVYGTTRADLHLEKISPVKEREVKPESFELAHFLEQTIADWFSSKTALAALNCQQLMVSTRWPRMAATPDFWVHDAAGRIGVLQAKAPGWAYEELPRHVWAQLQQEMAVTGLDKGWCCSFGGSHGGPAAPIFEVGRDDEWIENVLVPGIEDFWHRIENNLAPRPDAHEQSRGALSRIKNATKDKTPDTTTATAVLPASLSDVDWMYERAQRRIKQYKALQTKCQNEIRCALIDMGADELVLEDGRPWTWKLAKDGVKRTLRRGKVQG